jgi:hypothetical protein
VLYSARSAGVADPAGAALVAVDRGDAGYLTATAAGTWSRLAAAGVVVPVTTRSVPQYLRLRLPGPAPRHALTCNGARLLVDGEPDAAWDRAVRQRLSGVAEDFAVVWQQAVTWHAERAFKLVRAVEDFFVYLTVASPGAWPPGFGAEAGAWAQARGWGASLQGRKLYLVPAALGKASAVADLAERLSAGPVIAGGDSLLDAEMLRVAHAAIRPAHGELHRIGFAAPNCAVTAATGIAAGEEIVSWYAQRAGVVGADSDPLDGERRT